MIVRYLLAAYVILLVFLFLIRCTSPVRPCTPVDVRVQDGYCFLPLTTNQDIMRKECGFATYSSCKWVADPDADGYVYGTCEADYILVRECTDE